MNTTTCFCGQIRKILPLFDLKKKKKSTLSRALDESFHMGYFIGKSAIEHAKSADHPVHVQSIILAFAHHSDILYQYPMILLLLADSEASRKHTYIILTPLNPTFIQ